jgi:preprotein translocase subunit SecE
VTSENTTEETKETKETQKTRSSNKKVEKKSVKSVNPVTRYLRETRGELRKVIWPTRQESTRLTAIVIAVSTAMAVFLWFWDLIFSQSIHLLINTLVS